MIPSLLALLIVTIVATWWARQLAADRCRHIAGWAFATALLPLVVLVLWALPARPSPVRSS